MSNNLLKHDIATHTLRAFVYAVVMAGFACVVSAISYPGMTGENYLVLGIVVGIIGMLSWQFPPVAVGLTLIFGAGLLWNFINGIPASWPIWLAQLIPSGIPLLLSLWRRRRQNKKLSA